MTRNDLRDKAFTARDREGEPHELPVRLLLLLVCVVRDLEAGRIVCAGRHPEHEQRREHVQRRYIFATPLTSQTIML